MDLLDSIKRKLSQTVGGAVQAVKNLFAPAPKQAPPTFTSATPKFYQNATSVYKAPTFTAANPKFYQNATPVKQNVNTVKPTLTLNRPSISLPNLISNTTAPSAQLRPKITLLPQPKLPTLQSINDYFSPTISDTHGFWGTGVAKGLGDIQKSIENWVQDVPVKRAKFFGTLANRILTGDLMTPFTPEEQKTASDILSGFPMLLSGGLKTSTPPSPNVLKTFNRGSVQEAIFPEELPAPKVKVKPVQTNMTDITGVGRVSGKEAEIAMEKLRQAKIQQPTAISPLEQQLEKVTLNEQMGGGLFGKKIVYSGQPVGIPQGNVTFYVDNPEMAQKYADLNKTVTGQSEVVAKDISNLNLKEVPQKEMQTAIENPEILAKYDGVKFKVEGQSGNNYVVFNKPSTVQPVEPQPTPEQIAEYERQIISEVKQEMTKTPEYGPHQKDFNRFIRIVKMMGEKTSSKTGMLFREHIPKAGVLSSSDEIASSLGISENELMARVVEKAGVAGGVPMPQMPKPLSSRPPTINTGEKKSFIPRLTKPPWAMGQENLGEPVASMIPSYSKQPRMVPTGEAPYAYGQKPIMINGKQVNIHPKIMKKIVDRQLNKINILRKRARLPLRTFKQFLQDVTGKDSPKKLTYEETKVVKTMLTPAKGEEFKQTVARVKEKSLNEKVQKITDTNIKSTSPLEKKYKTVEFVEKTRKDVEILANNFKKLSSPGKVRGNVLQPFLAESTAASIGGVKPFQVAIKNIVDLSNIYNRRFKTSLKTVFADLTEEQKKAVLKLTSGVQIAKVDPMLKQRAEYLKEIFTANLKLTNTLRDLRGLKPIPKRKSYIPFYLQPEFREVFGLGESHRFDVERTKTNKELLAGLFSLDSNTLIEKYVDASSKFLRRNIYGAFLSDKATEWIDKSTYAKQLVEKNILNMPTEGAGYLREQAEMVDGLLAKIMPKEMKLSSDLQQSLKETSFYEDPAFKKMIDSGILKLPRFKSPDLTGIARDTFVLSKLAFNTRFFVTNLTQTILGIPFTGVTNFAAGEIKILTAFMPKNLKELQNLNNMMTELGAMSDRMVSGEEISAYGHLTNKIYSLLGAFGRVSELHNRLSSGVAGERFLKGVEQKTGMNFTPEDFNKLVNEYAKFIHFVGGPGYSAITSRNPVAKLFYIFQQYGLYVMRVYGKQLQVAFKDTGVKDFWKTMVEEGGASDKAKEVFDKLPNESKARLLKVILGMFGGASIILMLTGSKEAFNRLLPLQGITPDSSPAYLQILNAILGYLKDPNDDTLGKLSDAWKKTFAVTQLSRLEDAYQLWKEGKIVDKKGKVLYKGKPGDVFKLGFWGRGITFEKDIQEKQDIYKVKLESVKRGDDEGIKAYDLFQKIENLPKDQRKVQLSKWKKEGTLTKGIYSKMETLWENKQLGFTQTETAFRSLPVKERAQYIKNKVSQLPVEKQRGYLVDLKKNKILTEDTFNELVRSGYKLPPKTTGALPSSPTPTVKDLSPKLRPAGHGIKLGTTGVSSAVPPKLRPAGHGIKLGNTGAIAATPPNNFKATVNRLGPIPPKLTPGGQVPMAVDLIKKYFPPEQWNNAYKVMMGESGGNPMAIGDNYPIRGEVRPSYGLFQIRTFPDRPPPKQLLNPETNVAYAAKLWKQRGWSPTWTAATKQGIK